MSNLYPRVVTNIVEFNGEQYEVMQYDFENSLLHLKHIDGTRIIVHITDVKIVIEGRKLV